MNVTGKWVRLEGQPLWHFVPKLVSVWDLLFDDMPILCTGASATDALKAITEISAGVSLIHADKCSECMRRYQYVRLGTTVILMPEDYKQHFKGDDAEMKLLRVGTLGWDGVK